MVSEKLGHALGQTIVVENKAGQGGSVGAAELALAPPDGCTIGDDGRRDVSQRLSDPGLDLSGLPPAQLAALVRAHVPRLGKVVKDGGGKAE